MHYKRQSQSTLTGMTKSDNGKIVYLFSSAYHKLYKQDVLDVLALPKKFRFHFRYDEPWVAKEILENHHAIVGKQGIVVFVDRALRDEEEREPKFYPIRIVTIVDSKMEGSTIHVYFELGTYVGYPVSLESKASYDHNLKNTLDKGNRPFLYNSGTEKKIAGKFIGIGGACQLSLPDYVDENQAAAWQDIVTTIELDCPNMFRNAIFFRLVKIKHLIKPPINIRFWGFIKEFVTKVIIKKVRFKKAFQIAKNKIYEQKYEEIHICDDFLPPQTGYMLKSGDYYLVDLSFYRKNPPSEEMQKAVIDIYLDPSFFHASLNLPITVSFRYDYRSFDLVVKHRLSSSLTKIRIGLKKEERFMSPCLFFPTYVEAPRVRLILSVFVFLFGSGLVAISSSGLIQLEWLKRIFLAVGPFLQTTALWFIYRRLK